MSNQECKGIFVSHASEDKESIVDPLIECLERYGIKEVWYDKNEIQEGHSIIREINEGLSRSKIGIIIFASTFLEKPFTNWELNCLTYFVIYNKIRLIPLLKNIKKERIIEKYPLLAPVSFKDLTDECDENLTKHINEYLAAATALIENPNRDIPIKDSLLPAESKASETKGDVLSYEITEIDQSTLKEIYEKIQDDSNPQSREYYISKIRTLSAKKRIWIYKESWEIVRYLIFSDNKTFVKDGLYILGEMLKLSDKSGDHFVETNARELFLYKLIDLLDPLNEKRIFYDSLDALEIILGHDSFLTIFTAAFLRAIQEINAEKEYSAYMQGMEGIEKYKSEEFISNLLSKLEYFIGSSEEERTKNRKEVAQFKFVKLNY